MTLTINTLDGKSIQAEVTEQEYCEHIRTLTAKYSSGFLSIKTGDVEHTIRTKHIVSFRVAK